MVRRIERERLSASANLRTWRGLTIATGRPASARVTGVNVHVRSDRTAFRCDTDGEGLAELVRRLRPLSPRLAVMEASSGYESLVARTPKHAGRRLDSASQDSPTNQAMPR